MSLSYIGAINRELVNMLSKENDRVIVRSTIELAHNLGLVVVAEGVESEAIWLELCALDCDVGQGFIQGRRCLRVRC